MNIVPVNYHIYCLQCGYHGIVDPFTDTMEGVTVSDVIYYQ